MQIEEAAERAVLPLLRDLGCELWDVIFEKDGALYYLKIHLYKKRTERENAVVASLDSDLCERATRVINDALDSAFCAGFMGRVDGVEVGSPGVTRRLRKAWHFAAVLDLAGTAGAAGTADAAGTAGTAGATNTAGAADVAGTGVDDYGEAGVKSPGVLVSVNRKGNYMSGILERFDAESGVVVLGGLSGGTHERFKLSDCAVTLDYNADELEGENGLDDSMEDSEELGELYE